MWLCDNALGTVNPPCRSIALAGQRELTTTQLHWSHLGPGPFHWPILEKGCAWLGEGCEAMTGKVVEAWRKEMRGTVVQAKLAEGGRGGLREPDVIQASLRKGAPLWHEAWAAITCPYSQLICEDLCWDNKVSFSIVSWDYSEFVSLCPKAELPPSVLCQSPLLTLLNPLI